MSRRPCPGVLPRPSRRPCSFCRQCRGPRHGRSHHLRCCPQSQAIPRRRLRRHCRCHPCRRYRRWRRCCRPNRRRCPRCLRSRSCRPWLGRRCLTSRRVRLNRHCRASCSRRSPSFRRSRLVFRTLAWRSFPTQAARRSPRSEQKSVVACGISLLFQTAGRAGTCVVLWGHFPRRVDCIGGRAADASSPKCYRTGRKLGSSQGCRWSRPSWLRLGHGRRSRLVCRRSRLAFRRRYQIVLLARVCPRCPSRRPMPPLSHPRS
jgi:hypothetical protein